MEALFSSRQWCSSPKGYWTIQYEHQRSGSDMQYRFSYKVWINSGGWFYNAIKMPIYLNGTNIATIQVKTYNNNETGWTYSGTTGWYTVSNKTSGTTSFYVELVDTGGYAQANWNKYDTSATFNLTVDPAKSVLGSVANFTIGNAIPMTITKYSSSFVDNLVIKYGSTTVKTVNGITNGTSVSFTTSELNTIYSLMSTVNSGAFSFEITTYNGSTSVGSSSQTATGSITGANPTFSSSNITYKDNNSTTTAVTGNNQYLVQNLSKLLVTITAATGNKGATISKYEATLNGVTKTITSAGNIDYGVINSGSNLTLSVKVTDSRGNTSTATKTIQFLPWTLPTAIINLKRKNNYEDTSYLKVQASCSSINSKNSVTIQYQYKKTTASSYSTLTSIGNNTQITLTLTKDSAWDFKIVVTDKFGSTTYNTVLAKGQFIFFVDTKKLSVGINCFPTNNESLEVNGQKIGAIDFNKIYPVGSIYMSVQPTNPKTLFGIGTWTQLKSGFIYATSNTSGVTGTSGNGTGTSTGAASGNTGSTALTEAQMPSHYHTVNDHSHAQRTIGNDGNINPWVSAGSGGSAGVYTRQQVAWYNSGKAQVTTYGSAPNTNSKGSGSGHTHTLNSHTHTVPYISVYIWKRDS